MPREVPLTRGQVAIVDDGDFDRVAAKRWTALWSRQVFRAVSYTYENGRRLDIGLGRFILDAPDGLVVDHINGDPLDNRRENLRLCSPKENARNRRSHKPSQSGFKGVFIQRWGRAYARICVDGVSHALGGFATAEEAARAYDEAALRLHGEFASLNFPPPCQEAA